MTDTPSTRLDREEIDRLEADERNLPPGPWELWTACSFRRITGPDGKDGGVLHAYNQRSDGHPDLSMPEEQLFSLVRLRNALPALLSTARLAEELAGAVKDVLDEFERGVSISTTRERARTALNAWEGRK